MAEFVTSLTTVFSGVFGSIVTALQDLGGLLFSVNDTGAITGVAPFGLILIIGIAVPLATWLFNKLFTWIRSIGRPGR